MNPQRASSRPLGRLGQIALAYFLPWPIRLWTIAAIVFVTWLLCLREANYAVQLCIQMIGGSLAVWIAPLCTGLAKEHLADPRAALTPGFRGPHLAFAFSLAAVLTVGLTIFSLARAHYLPAPIGWPRAQMSTLGFLSLVLLGSAGVAWMAQLQSATFIFSLLAVIGWIATQRGEVVQSALLEGRHVALTVGGIVVAVLAFAGLAWRLALMHEEMAEYFRGDGTAVKTRIAMTGDRTMRRAAASQTGRLTEILRGAHRLDTLDSVVDAPFWRRVQRWRLASGAGQVNWISAAAIAAILGAIYYFSPDHKQGEQVGLLIVIPTVLSLVVPITATGFSWPQRWFMLAGESLRPIESRSRFLREQGAAMAVEMANIWFWFTIGSLLPALVLHPKWVLSAHVGGTLLLTAAAQVWAFGVGVSVLRFRPSQLLNLVIIIGALIAAGMIIGWQTEGGNKEMIRVPSPAWALLMAAAGAVLALDAYRRWLHTDLD